MAPPPLLPEMVSVAPEMEVTEPLLVMVPGRRAAAAARPGPDDIRWTLVARITVPVAV